MNFSNRKYNSICFMHYSKHNKWTIANSWGWHVGNGIVIYLGEKTKYNYNI